MLHIFSLTYILRNSNIPFERESWNDAQTDITYPKKCKTGRKRKAGLGLDFFFPLTSKIFVAEFCFFLIQYEQQITSKQ